MGPDAPVPERRGGDSYFKPVPRRREEWMEEGSRGGGAPTAKLSPTRAPSRLAAPLFSRSSQPLQPHQPPQQQTTEIEFQQGPPSPGDPGLLSQSGNHLHVLHPAINNLSFSTAHAHTRLGEALKRSPLQGAQGRLKERNVVAPPLMSTSRSHARRLGERGTGLQTCESVDRESPPPPPAPLAWATAAAVAGGRRLAPMRFRGSLMPGTAPDDFSLPNVPGATGSPTKGLKKKEKLPNMEVFPSPDKPSATGNKRNTSALDRELS
ncbi:hypothetical protein B566_EDAN008012 [Ephemera danica]|nr:hypothetical protein B566_EDAN008012 [Ephemera danica]